MVNELLLEQIVANPRKTALIVDYGGCLAPVVEDPNATKPLAVTQHALMRAASVIDHVFVISGRPARFLFDAFNINNVTYVGLYGHERMQEGVVITDERVHEWSEQIQQAADEAARQLPDIRIENKNGIAITLHWRTMPEREMEVRACAAEIAHQFGLHAPDRGRMVVELRPPLVMDKGVAVRTLVKQFEAAVYIGDDLSDMPAFLALSELKRAQALHQSISVAVHSEEEPMALLAAADGTVDGPEGVAQLLDSIADRAAAPRVPID